MKNQQELLLESIASQFETGLSGLSDIKDSPLIYAFKSYIEHFEEVGFSPELSEKIVSNMTIELPIFELTDNGKACLDRIATATANALLEFNKGLEHIEIKDIDQFLVNYASKISLTLS